MIIKKLNLENIRSYKNLELELNEGSTLLSGNIGSGKTSILLGLQFALFGLQPGQKGSSILRKGEKTAKARVVLEVDSNEIILERSIKKSNSGSITQDSNCITINGQREELSTSEMKDKVMRILNYPLEFAKKSNLLYKFTVYTPQEEMKSIIQERPEVRLDTLRHVFGIDRYRRIKENAGIFLQRVKSAVKIKEVLSAELNLLKEKYSMEVEKKIKISRILNNLEIEKKSRKKELEVLEENLEALEKKHREIERIKNEASKIEALIKAKEGLEEKLSEEIRQIESQLENKIDFSEEKLIEVSSLLEKHRSFLEEKNSMLLKISSIISGLESKKEIPQKMVSKIESLENCPTCLQEVHLEHKERIRKKSNFEIEEIAREIESKIIEKENLKKEIEREKEIARGYEEDLMELKELRIKFNHQKNLEEKLKANADSLKEIKEEIEDLKLQLEKLREKITEDENLEESLANLKEKFSSKREEFRKLEIEHATTKKELDLLKEGLLELEEEIKQKEKVKDEALYLRSIQDWVSENFVRAVDLTEKNVLTRLKNEFSKIFSEWFSLLATDDLRVRLDEDFTPIITNQDYDIDYEFLSGGERTAVALAYRLALNQVLNSVISRIKTKGIIILDEPTDGFSSEQLERMRDIFEQLNARQLILVSHEQKIEGFVDRVIKIKKEKESRIEPT